MNVLPIFTKLFTLCTNHNPQPTTHNPQPKLKPKLKLNHLLHLLSICVFIITAILSTGYLHADEHYQIIEFAQSFRDKTDTINLSWEYHDKIRSAFMPIIASAIFEIADFWGIKNPFDLALSLRLLTGLLTLLIMTRWLNSISDPLNKKLSIFTSILFCFMPYIGVRFSSETWSGLFLLLTWISLQKASTNMHYFILGCILGISFLCRFQIIVMIIILGIYLIVNTPKNFQKTLYYFLGVMVVIGLGIILDSWFYGELTFSFWNYSMAFLFPKNPAAFDSNSWHFFIDYFTKLHIFILAPLLLFATIIFIANNPKNIIVWWLIGFIAFHQIIPHKEFRFLIPLAFLIPVILHPALQLIANNWQQRSLKITFLLLLVVNLYSLPFFCFKPAGIGRISALGWISDQNIKTPLKITCTPYANPLNPWGGYGNSFYQPAKVHFSNITDINYWTPNMSKDTTEILIIRNEEWKNEAVKTKLRTMAFSPVFRSIPQWVISGNRHLNWFDNDETLIILKHQ